ncbi:hypothetical protein EMCRGX_G003381 [Ephydatia muelleri]
MVKTISDRTATIDVTQTDTVTMLNDTRLSGLDQAKKIKAERDQSSEKKLSAVPLPTKRRRLDEDERPGPSRRIPDNIVNLSSYRLSNRETDILSKGLSFIPYTPNINYIKSSEIIDFTNKLRLRYKYMHITPSDNPFRLKTKQTPGPTDYKPLEKLIDNITLTLSQIKSTTGRPNLPKDGMCLIHRLKNQHEVIINQADKGSTIVLLDRKTYVAEGHKHLADPETYTRLEHDITDKIKQTIETKLDNLYKSGLLTKRQCEFCYPPESHRTSLMYFLIKLHKNPHTYRPICSCVNSIMANISGFLDFWLKQAVVLLPTYIRDTTHLIQTLEKHTFCKDIILCTVDVTNMYTNIPTAEGNQAAIRALTTLKNSTPTCQIRQFWQNY